MAKKEKTPAPPADAESAGDGGSAEAPASKGGKLKLILIVVLAVLIGAGGTFAAQKFLGGSDSTAEDAPKSEETTAPETIPAGGESGPDAQTAAPAETEAVGPQHIEFKPFIVNLNDGGGKRYLKLTMSVEVDSEALGLEINSKMPMFRDTILLLLSSLSYDDISTLDGKLRLRSQMLNRINTQLTSGKIKNIYFAEFVVQ